MLGSLHDAEDALQETLLRAWRGLPKFEGRSSLRSWLYTIATNTCLNAIERRPKRVLPVDYAPPADPHGGPGEPVVESVWVEPYPDELLGLEDGFAAPEARYEQRESVELAFIAALQNLPPNQRAALILREVLGFSAKEVAETLDTTTQSVNSALQRARKTVDERLPDQTQQATIRSLGDDGLRKLVDNYVDAWNRDDVDAVVAMLTEDASFAMPPLRTWFGPREAIATFLGGWPLSGHWDWRQVRTRAPNTWSGAAPRAMVTSPLPGPFSWISCAASLRKRGRIWASAVLRISDVTAFVTRSIEPEERAAYARWPDQPADPRRAVDFFERFGLPDSLPRD